MAGTTRAASKKASRTCELAGFGRVATIDPDQVEWNYGEYEGLRSDEILALRPDWELFRRALSSRACSAMAGNRPGTQQQAFPAQHRQPERRGV
jgi:hypothetical protein